MWRSHNTQQEKEELQRRIRGLTTILHKFAVQTGPSKQPRDNHSLLRHFTTLLTCGSKYDTDAKRVIAVTGSIDSVRPVRTLVVSQNPHKNSTMQSISLKLVKKRHRPLNEVVAGPPNPDLIDHIADTCDALSTINRRAKDFSEQIESLEIFFLSRSIRKFTARFRSDTRLCGGEQLAELIDQWEADRHRPEITPKWINPPRWLVDIEGLPEITSTRMVKGQLEWAFSDETKRDWSKILVAFLSTVDKGIKGLKEAKDMGKKGEKMAHEKMKALNYGCRLLYYFVFWKAEIVRDLLTKTNMVDGITTTFMSMRTGNTTDEVDDELAELQPEPGESKGDQVLRYLRTVVAWHAAIYALCSNEALPGLLKNIEIGLIEVPSSPPEILTQGEISAEFFRRFPVMVPVRQEVDEILKSRYSDSRRRFDNNYNVFFGCVHAEATLMGLLNYYSRYSAHAGQDVGIENPQGMQRIVEPVAEAGEAVIAVSKKCCWCCDWLGKNLESQFTLPGTHGMMYPWDPPKVGVSELVLKKLEDELWNQLHEVVLKSVESSYSRQSSPASSTGLHDELYISVPKSFSVQR